MGSSVLCRPPRPPSAFPCPWRSSSVATQVFHVLITLALEASRLPLEDAETIRGALGLPVIDPARTGATQPRLASPAAAVGSPLGSRHLRYHPGDHADARFATTRQRPLLRPLSGSVLCHQAGHPVLFLAMPTADEAPSLSKKRPDFEHRVHDRKGRRNLADT